MPLFLPQELVRLHRAPERELLGAGGQREFYSGAVQLSLESDALPVRVGVSEATGGRGEGEMGCGRGGLCEPVNPGSPCGAPSRALALSGLWRRAPLASRWSPGRGAGGRSEPPTAASRPERVFFRVFAQARQLELIRSMLCLLGPRVDSTMYMYTARNVSRGLIRRSFLLVSLAPGLPQNSLGDAANELPQE